MQVPWIIGLGETAGNPICTSSTCWASVKNLCSSSSDSATIEGKIVTTQTYTPTISFLHKTCRHPKPVLNTYLRSSN